MSSTLQVHPNALIFLGRTRQKGRNQRMKERERERERERDKNTKRI
jgi:hypothetical protein